MQNTQIIKSIMSMSAQQLSALTCSCPKYEILTLRISTGVAGGCDRFTATATFCACKSYCLLPTPLGKRIPIAAQRKTYLTDIGGASFLRFSIDVICCPVNVLIALRHFFKPASREGNHQQNWSTHQSFVQIVIGVYHLVEDGFVDSLKPARRSPSLGYPTTLVFFAQPLLQPGDVLLLERLYCEPHSLTFRYCPAVP